MHVFPSIHIHRSSMDACPPPRLPPPLASCRPCCRACLPSSIGRSYPAAAIPISRRSAGRYLGRSSSVCTCVPMPTQSHPIRIPDRSVQDRSAFSGLARRSLGFRINISSGSFCKEECTTYFNSKTECYCCPHVINSTATAAANADADLL